MARRKRVSDDDQILSQAEACIREGVDYCTPIHDRIEENNRYVRGFQWAEGDIDRQKEKDRPALPLNSLVKVVNAVANREIMDRIVPRAYGRSREDAGVAQVMDEMMRWQRDMSETEHEESMAFRSTCTSGYGVMHKWWDEMALDGNGMIRDEDVPVWYMLWDSKARKQNVVDRRWHISGKYVPLSEARDAFGDSGKMARGLFKKYDHSDMFSLDKDPYSGPSPSAGRWGWADIAAGAWYMRAEQELFIMEYEWKESKKVWKVSYPSRLDEASGFVSGGIEEVDIGRQDEQGQPQPFTQQEWFQLDENEQANLIGFLLSSRELMVVEDKQELEAISQAYEMLTDAPFEDYYSVLKEHYRFAIISDGVVLDKGVRPFGFTYEFITGFPYEQRSGMDFFGMCDIAKGPQDMKNVFLSNMLSIYMTSPKGSMMVEEGAVENTQMFANQWAKPGGVQFVPDGFLTSQRFLHTPTMQFPPMLEELVQMTTNAVQEEFGLSSIEQGTQGDLRRITSNVASAARQASNTILAILFDGLRRYRKRWGMLDLKFIQQMYTLEEVGRVVGQEVAQGLQGYEDWPAINIFDIKIDEAPTSVSEQLETMEQLTRTGTLENWVAAGLLAFEDAIDLMVNLPQSTRERIKANSKSMQQLKGQISDLQNQLQEAQQKEVMWQTFVQTIPEGQTIMRQFQSVYMLAQQMHQQMMQQQNQESPQQG